MLAAEIQHLLGFLDRADHRASQRTTAGDDREGVHWDRMFRHTEKHHGAIDLQQAEIGIPVDFRRNGAEDQVEGTGELFEGRGIAGGIIFLRTKLKAVFLLGECLRKHGDIRAHG